MKHILSLILAISVTSVSHGAINVSESGAQATITADAPPRLPYGVGDVLKLTRAKVGEEIIVTYIQSSGLVYGLKAQDIVYLRDEGVSDKVIMELLNQSRRVAQQQPAPIATQTMQPQPQYVAPPAQPVYEQPVYTEPASSLYVIPAATPAYPYYYSSYGYGGYYPYYSSYRYFGCYPSYSSFCYPRYGFSAGYRAPYYGFGGRSSFSVSASIGGRSGGGFHGGFVAGSRGGGSVGGRSMGGGHSMGGRR
jgi:hypothetical protein